MARKIFFKSFEENKFYWILQIKCIKFYYNLTIDNYSTDNLIKNGKI